MPVLPMHPTEPLDDEQVAARVLDGDTAAFELLMRRHNQRLYRLACSVVGERDAEDVVQEAYLRAFRALADFEGRSSLATWMSRITLHEALRVRRKNAKLRIESEDGDAWPSEASGPLDRVEQDEEHTRVVDALSALPLRQRTVLMLRLIEDLSTRDTATILGISEPNVKVLLHRAKHGLAEALKRRGIDRMREALSFAGERCDRIVAGVLARLAHEPARDSRAADSE